MKILYVHYNNTIPSTAAPTYQIFNMCQSFAKLGHKVMLLCFVDLNSYFISEKMTFKHYGIAKRFKLLRLPIRRLYLWLEKIYLGKLFVGLISIFVCLLWRTDLLYTRQSVVAFYGLKFKQNVIYETHPFPFGNQRYWDGKDYEPKFMSLTPRLNFLALVVLSPLVAQAFSNMGVSEDKIIVQPSGVDIERFANPISKAHSRRVLGISLDEKIVVYAGRFSKLKGTSLIFHIAAKMSDVKFYLLGYWGEKEIEDEFNKYYANKNIEEKGVISGEDLPFWLSAGDVLILPTVSGKSSSRWTSPIKLFEYMASGRPIVASKLPNIASVLTSDENAILVENDSIEGFINGIRYLLENAKRARTIGRKARELTLQYTWDKRAEHILSHVRE